jgi:hypothetical protein
MTSTEIQELRELLTRLDGIDVPKSLAEAWPNQDLAAVPIRERTAMEFLSLHRRVITHLLGAITDDPVALPRVFSIFEAPRTTQSIIDCIRNYISHIEGRSWNDADVVLSAAVNYLMLTGFWAKAVRRAHGAYDRKVAELLSEAELRVQELRSSVETLRGEKDALIASLTERKTELEEIASTVVSARTDRSALSTLLQEASTDRGELTNIVKTQNDSMKTAQTQIGEATELRDKLEAALKAIEATHESSKKSAEWIAGKRGEITELTGKAADGSLGGTFRSRKDELKSSVKTWTWITVASTILAAAYVPIAFTLIPSPSGGDWLVLVANLGKLFPVMLFLSFVLRQYSRERSFLEEYSFKTAVALVVNAYADQLAGNGSDQAKSLVDFANDQSAYAKYLETKNDERKKLIKETVDRLFTTPKVHDDRTRGFLGLRPKMSLDTVREARELLKEFKNL